MKVLVLGANGQLGSDLMRAGQAANDFAMTGLTRADLDLTDHDAIGPALDALDFDVLVNCTGYHKTDEVEANPGLAFDLNAGAVQTLAEACARKQARLVHISTDYVFDGAAGRPYTEDAAPRPLNVYGASKLTGEALARRAHDDVLILRVASLFGVAGSSGKGGNFVETMIRVGTEKGALRVLDDVRMSPTATADVAAALLEMLRREAPAGTYHVVNSGEASWYEFAREIIERAGVDATVEPVTSEEYPTAAARPAYSVLDNGRVGTIIGEMPHWQVALTRYLAARGHR